MGIIYFLTTKMKTTSLLYLSFLYIQIPAAKRVRDKF